MSPPAAAIVGGVALLYLAVRSPSVLVVDDYARIEELTTHRFAQDQAAVALGVWARLSLLDTGSEGSDIDLVLDGPPTFSAPETLVLRLRHVGSARGDRMAVLIAADDRYVGTVSLEPGRYDAEIEPPDGTWRLAGTVGATFGSWALSAQHAGARRR
jgi:hypothetical protein